MCGKHKLFKILITAEIKFLKKKAEMLVARKAREGIIRGAKFDKTVHIHYKKKR